jgi:thioredoxin reductase (NADPH)
MSETIKTDALIIGAGPCGLFQVFELGLLDIQAHVVDNLPQTGGQCSELYPDKPIYDIPAIPVCSAQELIDRLEEQIKPFSPVYHLGHEVMQLERKDDQRFHVVTDKGQVFDAATVIIAGGMGSFQPRKLPLKDAEAFEDKQIHYRVREPDRLVGKDLIVLGGGDSALDWVLELAERARSMTLIHRSEQFRAAPASVSRMRALVDEGKARFLQGNVMGLQTEGDRLAGVEVLQANQEKVQIPVDELLVFFGLSPKLGPIANWGLALNKTQIEVDTEKFQTNEPGIFAVGDINSYPGKKKLILSGFHEAALAAFAVKHYLEPDKKIPLQYTTTSPAMHKRLGV